MEETAFIAEQHLIQNKAAYSQTTVGLSWQQQSVQQKGYASSH